MKKQITLFSALFLLATAFILSASTLQEKGNKNGKGQKENNGKGQHKNGQPANDHKKNDNQNGKIVGQGNGKGNGNNGQGNQGNNKGKPDKKDKFDNPGKPHKDMSMYSKRYRNEYTMLGYNWTKDNFKERDRLRKQDKVTICHKFGNDSEAPVNIRVSANAAKAHLNHGDVMGDCPVITDRRYSDGYWRNRTDYYNNVQYNQEQVVYSSSILDYALQRLAGSHSQLAIMQSNNMPLADIERKQMVVNDLEENVSVLEQLIGLTANVVVNKLL